MMEVCDLCAKMLAAMHIYDRPGNWRRLRDPRQGDSCPRCHAVYEWHDIDEDYLGSPFRVRKLGWRPPTAIERLKEAISE